MFHVKLFYCLSSAKGWWAFGPSYERNVNYYIANSRQNQLNNYVLISWLLGYFRLKYWFLVLDAHFDIYRYFVIVKSSMSTKKSLKIQPSFKKILKKLSQFLLARPFISVAVLFILLLICVGNSFFNFIIIFKTLNTPPPFFRRVSRWRNPLKSQDQDHKNKG